MSTRDKEAGQLRHEVRKTYDLIARFPHDDHHCHTGRRLAQLLSYAPDVLQVLPDEAIESFAGVGNPFLMDPLSDGDNVVDVGSGAGFDCFVAERLVGHEGRVVGVEMTDSMLTRARSAARLLRVESRVAFLHGFAEELPIADGWADVVITNGVLNLCADKFAVLSEIGRILGSGGRLHAAEVASARPLLHQGRSICLAGALRPTEWVALMKRCGFVDVQVGSPVDIFAGARGELEARDVALAGYSFLATSSGEDRSDSRR